MAERYVVVGIFQIAHAAKVSAQFCFFMRRPFGQWCFWGFCHQRSWDFSARKYFVYDEFRRLEFEAPSLFCNSELLPSLRSRAVKKSQYMCISCISIYVSRLLSGYTYVVDISHSPQVYLKRP